MHSSLLLVSFPLALACSNSPHVGVWEAQRGNTVLDASNALGLKDYHEIINLNDNVNPLNIIEGKKYTVPYVASVAAPATWTTSSCTPVLYLSNTATRTGGSSDAATPKPTTLQRSPTTSVSPPTTLSSVVSSDISENSDVAPPLSSTSRSNSVRNSELSSVTSTETNDLVPTSTKTNDDQAPTPLCFDNPHDAHTDRAKQKTRAGRFCDNWIGKMMSNTTNILSGPTLDGDVLYQFSIAWIQGCDKNEQMVDEQCWGTMISNYENCQHNNGGGGRTDRGCLRYEYSPNKVDSAPN